jgi:hypothetical protein
MPDLNLLEADLSGSDRDGDGNVAVSWDVMVRTGRTAYLPLILR